MRRSMVHGLRFDEKVSKRAYIFVMLLLLSSCSLIDDDLSVCGVDCRIEYEIRLVTDMQMRIDSVLHAEADKPMADALSEWLLPKFVSSECDVEMNFYSEDEDAFREQHKEDIHDGLSSFTYYLPRENYYHLAVANIQRNASMRVIGSSHSQSYTLAMPDADEWSSLERAVYTARLPMDVAEEADNYTFHVSLYSMCSAAALVLDAKAQTMRRIEAYVLGTASQYNLRDSVYGYAESKPVRCTMLTEQCMAAVTLPTQDASGAGAPIRGVGRNISAAGSGVWQMEVHVTLPDGTVTRTVLDIDEAIPAGDLAIIRCAVQDDGSVLPVESAHVGVSVSLDWKEGSEHEVNM